MARKGMQAGEEWKMRLPGGQGPDLKGLVILPRNLAFILWGMDQRRGAKSRAP